ncbi:hypothetical protein LX32DRAFT_347870 [Colletotrichum zoysiae]|uniref:Secreted protein n=1 Tax=Colletotrichum zoysiae TaxID=1216348 RepID=A0AAD9M5L9_9PEZI|nr:hypothetical protein LX32DRAFT_347870 [Colletotrichum zoysiae]
MNLVMTFWTLVLLRRTRALRLLSWPQRQKKKRQRRRRICYLSAEEKREVMEVVIVGWQFKDNFVFQVGKVAEGKMGKWEDKRKTDNACMYVCTYLPTYLSRYVCMHARLMLMLMLM